MDFLKMRQAIGAQLIRGGQLLAAPLYRSRGVYDELLFNNVFSAQVIRRGRVIQTVHGRNGVTVVGKNHMLDVVFGKGTPVTQVDPWYIGLINNSPSPVLSENDTLASHTGWTEWTSYSGNRKEWVDADAASKIKGTTTASSFTISATGVLYGICVAAVASGTSGVLWATGAFDSTLSVVNTDVINVTYGVRL
jgi:hypothetical protein